MSRFYLMASETGCAKYIHSEACSAVYPMLILVVMDAIGLAPWLNRSCSFFLLDLSFACHRCDIWSYRLFVIYVSHVLLVAKLSTLHVGNEPEQLCCTSLLNVLVHSRTTWVWVFKTKSVVLQVSCPIHVSKFKDFQSLKSSFAYRLFVLQTVEEVKVKAGVKRYISNLKM